MVLLLVQISRCCRPLRQASLSLPAKSPVLSSPLKEWNPGKAAALFGPGALCTGPRGATRPMNVDSWRTTSSCFSNTSRRRRSVTASSSWLFMKVADITMSSPNATTICICSSWAFHQYLIVKIASELHLRLRKGQESFQWDFCYVWGICYVVGYDWLTCLLSLVTAFRDVWDIIVIDQSEGGLYRHQDHTPSIEAITQKVSLLAVTKNICITFVQCWTNVVYILYKCFVFAGLQAVTKNSSIGQFAATSLNDEEDEDSGDDEDVV